METSAETPNGNGMISSPNEDATPRTDDADRLHNEQQQTSATEQPSSQPRPHNEPLYLVTDGDNGVRGPRRINFQGVSGEFSFRFSLLIIIT